MKSLLLKKYGLWLLVAMVLLSAFVYLEKNNIKYSIKLNKNKELSKSSQQILSQFTGEKAVKFEVYTQQDTVVAKKISKFLAPYKRINQELRINFIDPITNPNKVKQNAINMQGEILLHWADAKKLRQIHITELSETAIINALLRLQNDKEEWLLFAEGYGMASVEDDSAIGISQLLFMLKKTGVHVARMQLSPILQLPDNVKVIVLPAPTVLLTDEIVQWIKQQLDKGISFWWLADVDAANQSYLEIAFDTILGDKQLLNADKYSTTVIAQQNHAITENFNQPIYLAEAIEVITENSKTLIESFNKNSLAIAKQSKTGRMVITGDVNFISNQFLKVAANKSFTMRIIDWLFYHDDRVNIATHINKNTQLYLTQNQLIALSAFFLILLPLVLLIIAIITWRKGRV